MLNSKLLLVIAGILIVIGVVKPDLSALHNRTNNHNSVVTIVKPTDKIILEKCEAVISAIKNGTGDKSRDAKKLASLYNDLAYLIELDGDQEVIKTTEEIRQANSLAGVMLQLNIRGNYPDLADAAKDLIVTQIGDDSSLLDISLRQKAANAFRSLAWACNEGSK